MSATATTDDIERATIPSVSSQRHGLSIAILSTSARLVQTIRPIKSNLTFLKILKFSIGSLAGALTLMSAWWALDLAMWTSVKDFRDDCRSQLQGFNVTSLACQEALGRPLREPPTWRGYLGKVAQTMTGRSGYMKLRDDSYREGERPSRRHLALGPYGSFGETTQDELDGCFGRQLAGIRKQGDGAIMYGSTIYGWDTFSNPTFFFPLDETRQEVHDEIWELWQVNRLCDVWFNKTVTGTSMAIKKYIVPDQRDEPDAFEEMVELMPLDLQEEWRSQCVYPPVPESLPARSLFESLTVGLTKIDVGAVLGLTFIFVAWGHEVIYGGFARKTRWKWQ